MTGEPRSAKEVFLELVELPEEARKVRSAELERDAPALAARVRSLLEAHARARTLLPGGRPPGPPARLETGQLIGDYELLEIVGEGGAGVVYRARQVSLDRVVAVKVLRAGRFASEGELARFRAEAELAARLDHPRIVPVFEVGQLDGAPFFSMKFVEGQSLLSRAEEFDGDYEAIAGLVAEVARAVHHGHQRGVLHRDLKPSNVLLDPARRPYVADFGIAKRLDAHGPRTFTGSFRGTPSYMAPEQAAGREVTVRTDVYALGGLLYELLVDRPPARGESLAEVLREVAEVEPPRARSLRPDVPRDLETVATRCLAKDPARRYGSAEELARELERWLAGEPIEARPVSWPERAWLFARRRPLVASLGATVAILLAALAIGATLTSVRLGEHLARAQDAEEIANERLRASLLAGARLHRTSRVPGRRAEALAMLREAAHLRAGPDLVDEALAAIVLPDLELEREWSAEGGAFVLAFDPSGAGFVERTAEGGLAHVDAAGERRPFADSQGSYPWVSVLGRGARRLTLKRHPLAGAADVRIEVWDLPSGTCVLRLAESLAGRAAALDADEDLLLYGNEAEELVLVELATGAERARIPLGSRAHEIRLDPAGERVALALESGRIELRRAADAALLGALQTPAPVYTIDFLPDGRRILSGSADSTLRLWDVEKGELLLERVAHQAEVVHVRASPDGRWWTSYAWDETAILWDAQSGEGLLRASARPLEFSDDGKRLGFSTSSGYGRWRLAGGEALAEHFGHRGKSPTGIDVSPDGALLASSGPDGVLLRRLADGGGLVDLGGEEVRGVRFAPDGALLVAHGIVGLLRFEGAAGPARTLLAGRCTSLDLPRDGAWIAAVLDGGLVVLDERGRERARGALPPSPHRLAASGDGRWLACGNWQGVGAWLLDPASGALLRDLAPGERGVELAFDPAGGRLVLATGREYRVLRAPGFELEWTIPRELELAARPGTSVFAPDGRTLALSLTHRRIGLVDATSGQLLARLEPADPQPLSELRFSPDGLRLVAGTQTRRVEVWDLAALDRALEAAGLGNLTPVLGRVAHAAR